MADEAAPHRACRICGLDGGKSCEDARRQMADMHSHPYCLYCDDLQRQLTAAQALIEALRGMRVPADRGGGFYFDSMSRAKLARLLQEFDDEH
jgi:hypothetical protein